MAVMHSLYRESGNVNIDPKTCTRCGLCAKICPAEALSLEDGKIGIHNDSLLGCIACGHCMMVCPEGAISVSGRGVCSEDLMPLPDAETQASADGLEALMQSRRSVRRFTDKEVEPELLERIVAMASTAPMGIPPWDIGCVTVRGRKQVQWLAGGVIKGYTGFLKIFRPWVLGLMRPFIGKAKYEMFTHFIRPLAQSYIQNHREGRDAIFYDAPALLVFHHSAYADVADVMIACTYAMLATESLGLGSTIIGGAAPILQRSKVLCQKLGIPEGNKPSIVLILGYLATRFRQSIRRSFSSMNSIG